jgi:hypothetical protein
MVISDLLVWQVISTVTLVVTVIEDGALRRISIMEYIGRGS